MIQIQYFKNFSKPGSVFDDIRLWQGIRGEKMRFLIEPIRSLCLAGQNEKADQLKRKLPAVTISATFKGVRRIDNVSSYSQVVVLDFDSEDIGSEELNSLKDKASGCNFTLMAFVSPSGRGLKILVKVNSQLSDHKIACKQVTNYYSQLMNVKFDETFDITRLTFMSYDPDIYHYPDSEIFNVTTSNTQKQEEVKVMQLPKTISDEILLKYNCAYKYTAKKINYEVGKRNNFLFLLSSRCNRYGVPKEDLLQLINWCDLPSNEIKTTINSGYKNENEHNTWTVFSKSGDRSHSSYDNDKKVIEQLESSEYSFPNGVTGGLAIPIEIKKRLPSLISEFALSYDDHRQSDIAFITMFTFLSSVVDNVSGYYEKQIVYPQLFSMVIAEPGSGKSIMTEVSNLFQPLHRHLRHSTNKYDRTHGFYLSPHSSASTLIKQMSENNGKGCVFVPDVDFLGSALKNDACSFYALLNTSFSNEFLSTSKEIKGKALEIVNPRPAFCISGSMEQMKSLVPSSTISLFSRFIVYQFHEDRVWKDLTLIDTQKWKTFTSNISEKIFELYNYVQQREFEFRWKEEQYDAVNSIFGELLETVALEKGVNLSAVVKQLSVILFKFTMILSTLRAAEAKSKEKIIYCTDDDFDSAMQLIKIHYNHSVSVAPNLIELKHTPTDERLKVFYSSLPEEGFDRKTAIAVCKSIGLKISERTVDNFLKRLIDSKFLEKEYNNYQKVKKDNQSLKVA